MRVLLYADGSSQRGLGHVMRTIALAEEADKRGHEVYWCGRLDAVAMATLVRFGQSASRVHALGAEASAQAELLALVERVAPDVLHVDSYDLSEIADRIGRDVLLSGTQDHPNGTRVADLVFDPNLGAEARLEFDPPSARWVLPGLDFAALRTSVRAARGGVRRGPSIERVLVVMGGTDPLGLTSRIVAELARIERPLQITAVAPPSRHQALLQEARSHALTAVPFVHDLAALVMEHDLVVTAAGTSVWELCHIGVPMAVMCAVDNQVPGYTALIDAGAALGLGRPDELGTGRVAAKLTDAIEDPDAAWSRADAASSLIDGLGAWRTVSAWEAATSGPWRDRKDRALDLSRSTSLRNATMQDAILLYHWRNDVGTRRWSLSQEEVELDGHAAWLAGSLGRPDRLVWVALVEKPIGVVRWDQRPNDHWEVSITLAPQARGRRLAAAILAAAEERLAEVVGRRPVLLATVHRDNTASLRLFASAGYLPFAPEDDRGFATYVAWRGNVRSTSRSTGCRAGRRG